MTTNPATKPTIAALEGWYTLDNDKPHLIGTCCKQCGTYYFPKQAKFCRNPDCESTEFDEVQLSRTGKIGHIPILVISHQSLLLLQNLLFLIPLLLLNSTKKK